MKIFEVGYSVDELVKASKICLLKMLQGPVIQNFMNLYRYYFLFHKEYLKLKQNSEAIVGLKSQRLLAINS